MALKGSLGSSSFARSARPTNWNRGNRYVYDRQLSRPVRVDPKTGQSVEKSKSTKGTDYLTRYERAGTIGSGRSLEKSGAAMHDGAKGRFEEASKSLNDYRATAMSDGELRRSEVLEMGAMRLDKKAAAADGAAGRVRQARRLCLRPGCALEFPAVRVARAPKNIRRETQCR